jgi:ribosomal protein S18 acetylase RimI-like enzyme
LSIIIKEVTSKYDLKKFVKFPLKLYKDCSQWVPPLIYDEIQTLSSEKNPAYEYCECRQWLAYKGDEIVGRIAGIINHKFIEKWGKKAIRFGWIDFIDDINVSGAMIEKVIEWGKEKNLEYIHGPLGFTDFDYEGMLIEGFNEVGTMATIYNYEYYPKHMEKLGFEKEADWVEFEIKVPNAIPDKAERIAAIVKSKFNIRVVEAKNRKELLPYGKEIFDVINDAYKNLFGFVELTDKQIQKYIKQYFGFVSPDYLKILVDDKNKVAGFVIGMPSLTKALQKSKGKLFPFGFIHFLKALKKNNKYVDLYLGAIRPDLQGKGADALLMTELTRSCIKNKVISAESNIELETNVQVQGHWKYYDSRQHKRRRCFEKKIN